MYIFTKSQRGLGLHTVYGWAHGKLRSHWTTCICRVFIQIICHLSQSVMEDRKFLGLLKWKFPSCMEISIICGVGRKIPVVGVLRTVSPVIVKLKQKCDHRVIVQFGDINSIFKNLFSSPPKRVFHPSVLPACSQAANLQSEHPILS